MSPRGTYHRTHVAGISGPYPSKHDKTKQQASIHPRAQEHMELHLHQHIAGHIDPSCSRAVLKGPDFFFFAKDRPKGPPTANHQLPSTASHQPPPTASGNQPPTANHCQPPPTTNHQPPTTNRCQPPPTASIRQLPTANRQPPPTANCQPPPTMVEHMECPRAFLGKLVPEHFFFPLRTALSCSLHKAIGFEPQKRWFHKRSKSAERRGVWTSPC